MSKTCLTCKHFSWNPGHPAYGISLDGWGWELECLKGMWSLRGHLVKKAELISELYRARVCGLYKDD